MAKRAASTTVSLRSRSSRRPAIRACSGAFTCDFFGASWTSPSVIRMAPATRSGGTSASAALRAAKSWVPLSSPVVWVATLVSRTSRSFSPARRFLISVRAFSASARRVSMPMLCERSVTITATSLNGSRCSCTMSGLASTARVTAKASARAQAPRARRNSA